jgi:nicotinic acid mononucleotide adenylyltransferase
MKTKYVPCDVDVSSSYIRQQIENGGSFRFMVPRPVYARIVNNKLYGYKGDDYVIY